MFKTCLQAAFVSSFKYFIDAIFHTQKKQP